MRYRLTIFAALLLSCFSLAAQNPQTTAQVLDTLPVYESLPPVNTEYVGKNILEMLSSSSLTGGKVTLQQSDAIKSALSRHMANNESRKIHGYRVRIYFDNSQNARSRSESIAGSFSASYPGVAVYRSYSNPFFKVTVGDFRTRIEAQLFANRIAGIYPSAFLVKENINYPSLW